MASASRWITVLKPRAFLPETLAHSAPRLRSSRGWSIKDTGTVALWWIGLAAFLFFASVPGLHASQNLMSVFLVTVLISAYLLCKYVTPQTRLAKTLRLTIILINVFLSLRYMVWRATETLPLQFGLPSALLGFLLLLAELYGFINSTAGCFINSDPKVRTPIELDADKSSWPHVDVYIPTYNESAIVVGPTIIAATQLDYPKDKLHVYLLDDGGTEQKLNDPDPKRAAAARLRALELRRIAAAFGANYLTRDHNVHAKAGNINSALHSTSGELLLILDCDHIPSEDFLLHTVGFFSRDEKLFLVQTPHNFVSPDPVSRNLRAFDTCPAENELFYDVIQLGLDYWGTSFFCGSAAVLRRSVLDQLGGIAGQTITEDAETTMDALSLGYKTAYYARPMVSGLQPETYAGFILQRVRWGQGMLQIFLLKNAWRQRGMHLVQRLLYTNFALYWGFAAARLVMLLAPPMFLLFGVNLCDTSADDLLAYAVPTLIASLIATQHFYGKVRWPFISQLYEIIQSVYVTRALFEVICRPRAPAFQVTPKGETLERDVVSSLATPFYLLLALNVAGIVNGVVRYLTTPWSHGAIILVEFWALLDFFLLLCALGITFERRQMRGEPRVAQNLRVRLLCKGQVIEARATDVSASGAGVSVAANQLHGAQIQLGDEVTIDYCDLSRQLAARVVSERVLANGGHAFGLGYQLADVADQRSAVSIAFGSSELLIKNAQARHRGRSIVYGLGYVVRVGVTLGGAHLRYLVETRLRRLLQRQRSSVPSI
jgi:cellulose synthase (UDP-forming)